MCWIVTFRSLSLRPCSLMMMLFKIASLQVSRDNVLDCDVSTFKSEAMFTEDESWSKEMIELLVMLTVCLEVLDVYKAI